jgi:hypothetical protein
MSLASDSTTKFKGAEMLRMRCKDDEVKLRVLIYTFKSAGWGPAGYGDEYSQDYFYLTQSELADKCVIYGGQVVWTHSLPKEKYKLIQQGCAVPFDLYNYECGGDWREHEPTRQIVEWAVEKWHELGCPSTTRDKVDSA